MAAAQFVRVALDGTATRYYLPWLRANHAKVRVVLMLRFPLVKTLRQFDAQKTTEKLYTDHVFAAFVALLLIEVNWSSSGGSEGFIANDFVTGLVLDLPVIRYPLAIRWHLLLTFIGYHMGRTAQF